MAFQAAPDCAEAVIQGELFGEACYNTLNFKSAAPYTQADVDALAVAVTTAWLAGAFQACLSPGYTFVGTQVRGLTSVNDLESFSSGANTAGSATGSALPNNAAWTIKFTTGLTGRSARGRNYISGWTTQFVTTNTLDLAAANDFIATYLDIQTEAGIEGWTWGVLSRQTAGAPRTTAVLFPINNVSFSDLTMDSMRRRLPGRGA